MELNKSIALVVKLDVDVVFCVNDISSDLLNMPENSYLHEDKNCHICSIKECRGEYGVSNTGLGEKNKPS
jgi:hypothetical protein